VFYFCFNNILFKSSNAILNYTKLKEIKFVSVNNFRKDPYYNENDNWDVIEISKVNDKIIKRLLNYLKSEISENFFISFESLLKLGKKIPKTTINNILDELDKSDDFKKEIFKFILDFTQNSTVEYHLLPQLYNPDFILRARAIMKIEVNNDKRYIKFLLPLLEDPDDSVRYKTMKFLSKFKDNSTIYKHLKAHLDKELNPIIFNTLKEKLEDGL